MRHENNHGESRGFATEGRDGRPLFAPDANVRLVGDPTLGRGDCRAESGETTVFAELEVQLADVRHELLRSLGHAEHEP